MPRPPSEGMSTDITPEDYSHYVEPIMDQVFAMSEELIPDFAERQESGDPRSERVGELQNQIEEQLIALVSQLRSDAQGRR
jgi:hypothetical protein